MSDKRAEFRDRVHTAQMRFSLPAGARQIVLVRHGSSVGATVDTVQLGALTVTDPPLTPDGHHQAVLVARALAAEPVTAIVVTPLQRTRQTAEPLVGTTGIAPRIVADLREVHLGDWEHSFYEHAAAGHPLITRMFVEESWDCIPNAEPGPQFEARVRNGIEVAAAMVGPGETVIVFSHAATIAEICHQATGSRRFAFTAPENSSITRLIVGADGSWKLRSFNEVSHLILG